MCESKTLRSLLINSCLCVYVGLVQEPLGAKRLKCPQLKSDTRGWWFFKITSCPNSSNRLLQENNPPRPSC